MDGYNQGRKKAAVSRERSRDLSAWIDLCTRLPYGSLRTMSFIIDHSPIRRQNIRLSKPLDPH